MAILKIAKFSCAFQLSVHVVACVIIFCSAAIMASPLVGSIGEFDTSTETFTVYHERLEQYFVANSIGHYPSDASTADKTAANKKKVAVMISVIGKKTYGTLRENLKSFVSTMELYIVLQQRTNHPPMVRLNVLSRF